MKKMQIILFFAFMMFNSITQAQLKPPIDKKDYELYMKQQDQLRKTRMALWTSAVKKIYIRSMKLNDSSKTVNVKMIYEADGKFGKKEINFSKPAPGQMEKELADLMRSLPAATLVRNYEKLDSMLFFRHNETGGSNSILPETVTYKIYCEDLNGVIKYFGTASVINPGDEKIREQLDEMFSKEFKK